MSINPRRLLLAVATMAIVAPGSHVALNDAAAGFTAAPPLFTAIDLNPSGFIESWASGTSGGLQVGYGYGPATGGYGHALLWRGSARSVVDLHPSRFLISRALGISGDQQVGVGISPQPAGGAHALLWRGSAQSVVDLHPRGFVRSEASGISSEGQVGFGYGPPTGERRHALLWHGTAASERDLHPRGFVQSEASGISSGQQVGVGTIENCVPGKWLPASCNHALLWRSDGSVRDLNPREGFYSDARGVSGKQIVGTGGPFATEASGTVPATDPQALVWRSDGRLVTLKLSSVGLAQATGVSGGEYIGYAYGQGHPQNRPRAVLWRSDTESLIDLHAFLPPGFIASRAMGIDSNGDIVGDASGPATGNRSHAFLWMRNPKGAAPVSPVTPPTVPVPIHVDRELTIHAGDDPEAILVLDPVGHEFRPEPSPNGWDVRINNPMPGQYTVDQIALLEQRHFRVGVIIDDFAGDGNKIYHEFVGLAAPGRVFRSTISGDIHRFADIDAHVMIKLPFRSFQVDGTFSLDPGSTISPETQPVTFWVLRRYVTIPAGSFRRTGPGRFVFEGDLDASMEGLKMILAQTGDRNYSFKIEGIGAEIYLPTGNPVNVVLSIGDYGWGIQVNATFER